MGLNSHPTWFALPSLCRHVNDAFLAVLAKSCPGLQELHLGESTRHQRGTRERVLGKMWVAVP